MAINRRQLLSLGASAISASLLTGMQGCSAHASNRLIGGYQKPGGQFGVGAISCNLEPTNLESNSPESNHSEPDCELAWELPTQTRVHGVAVHNELPLGAIAARRPGDFIVVFDPQSGTQISQLHSPQGYFLEGHVEFSQQQLWATATSKKDSSACLLGWDLSSLKETSNTSSKVDLPGMGPHQVIRGDEDQLWVAIGGWETQNRKILNAETFDSFLLGVDLKTGSMQKILSPAKGLSLRHIAYSNGELYAGMQYPEPHPSEQPLAYQFKNNAWQALEEPQSGWQAFKGYIASIATNENTLVATSPQGHYLGVWNRKNLKPKSVRNILDVAGATNIRDQLFVSSGTGLIRNTNNLHEDAKSPLHWDNHWIGYQQG